MNQRLFLSGGKWSERRPELFNRDNCPGDYKSCDWNSSGNGWTRYFPSVSHSENICLFYTKMVIWQYDCITVVKGSFTITSMILWPSSVSLIVDYMFCHVSLRLSCKRWCVVNIIWRSCASLVVMKTFYLLVIHVIHQPLLHFSISHLL